MSRNRANYVINTLLSSRERRSERRSEQERNFSYSGVRSPERFEISPDRIKISVVVVYMKSRNRRE